MPRRLSLLAGPVKIPRHPRDLEHPPEVRLGMHEGDGPVLDGKQQIHQHRQTRGVDEALLIEGQHDLVCDLRQGLFEGFVGVGLEVAGDVDGVVFNAGFDSQSSRSPTRAQPRYPPGSFPARQL